jgi:hypothetical protein
MKKGGCLLQSDGVGSGYAYRGGIGPSQCETSLADLNDKAGTGAQDAQANTGKQAHFAQSAGEPVGPGNVDDDRVTPPTPFG